MPDPEFDTIETGVYSPEGTPELAKEPRDAAPERGPRVIEGQHTLDYGNATPDPAAEMPEGHVTGDDYYRCQACLASPSYPDVCPVCSDSECGGCRCAMCEALGAQTEPL